jgi:glutaredoxin-like protein NrdH
MTVTVYTKPACVQCVATYKELERKGVAYNVVDLTKDEAAFAKVQDMGYMAAPVVVAGDDHWSGFRPDKINALGNALVDA